MTLFFNIIVEEFIVIFYTHIIQLLYEYYTTDNIIMNSTVNQLVRQFIADYERDPMTAKLPSELDTFLNYISESKNMNVDLTYSLSPEISEELKYLENDDLVKKQCNAGMAPLNDKIVKYILNKVGVAILDNDQVERLYKMINDNNYNNEVEYTTKYLKRNRQVANELVQFVDSDDNYKKGNYGKLLENEDLPLCLKTYITETIKLI